MNNIIYEYQNIINDDLKNYILDTQYLHKYFKEDWEKLKARQYCGILNIKGKDYYILPKIANHNNEQNLNIFTYMLIYANDIKVYNESLANSKNVKSNNILKIFIQMFAKGLFKEFQKGIYREYITEQDNLTTLKGKYLINENLQYNFTKNKIYCEYDEFSQNNQLNQFFLYAINTLINFTTNKKLLKMCELVLDGVEYKHFDINTIDMHFNRLNNRFKASFEFALLLLKKSIPLFENNKNSFAFLFDMNDLFEKFIGNIYKSIDNDVELQKICNFGNLKLKPDIYSKDIIIDTKYKIVKNKSDLKRDDKYQMFVYGINFGIKNTILLYPKHIEDIEDNLKLGKDDKMVELKMRSIDLSFSGSYDEYIKEMKKRVEIING